MQPRIQRRLARLGPSAAIAGGPADEEPAMAERKKAELIGSSETPVRVTGATRASVKVDEQASKQLKRNLAAAAAGHAEAEPDRVYLKLEGIRGTSDAANYRVYIDLPTGADPKDYPDLYAGTISLFGVSAASDPGGAHAGSGVSQVLEITEIVDALHLSGDDLSQLKVQFIPAHENVAAADFSVGRLSVFRLGK
jgi:tyrosinase